jgi:exosortase/archaeosortase family protein
MATMQPPARGSRRSWFAPPMGLSWTGLVAVSLVAVTYHYSLFTLIRGLTLQTPLAYLALVPIGSVLLVWVAHAQGRFVDVRARVLPLDFALGRAVGVVLLLVALTIAVLLPASLGARFWLYRLDLLSLPFFVAGLVAVLFGVRRLWAVKSAVAFLLLAWPVPYGLLLGSWLDAFTDLTAAAVRAVNSVLPAARSVETVPDLFIVDHAGESFVVSVSSACSGVNSLVGFILIGIALLSVVRGSLARRIVWLGSGLTIVWLLNVARIELVLAAGALFGPGIALDVLHPVAGLLVFNLGVIAMILAVPRFGVRFIELPSATPAAHSAPLRSLLGRGSMIALGVAVALVVGIANSSYARYEVITGDLGNARLVRFDMRAAQIDGWSSSFLQNLDQARQFFGSQARWARLMYTPTAAAGLRSSHPLYVDVIDTDDAGSLAAYTIADCYQFHHFRIDGEVSADIGAGVMATVITYFDAKDRSDWSAIWWEWPKEFDGGVRYERIVVFIPNSSAVTFAGFDPSTPTSGKPEFEDAEHFLITAARDIVRTQLARTSDTPGGAG